MLVENNPDKDVAKEDAPSIWVNDVRVVYSNGVVALDGASFALSGGMVCALVGVNGSGKSTLFNTIMASLRPQQGEVRINGLPVKQAIRQAEVAYVPQTEALNWDFPIVVHEVVMQGRYHKMGWLRRAREQDKQAVWQAMAQLGISNLADRQIGALSGGQKKRVFLARALVQEAKILLLDEPFTGVDAETENMIMRLLAQLREAGVLVLVSTHNLGAVPQYCNEVVMLNRRVMAKGKTELVYTPENLARTFGAQLTHIQLKADSPAMSIVTDEERPALFYAKES